MFVLHRKLIKKATNSLILKLICESVAIIRNSEIEDSTKLNKFRMTKIYPTKLMIFPGTIMIFFGVVPANWAIVLSSAMIIS